MERTDYAGLNNFVWWTGVVEDIDDPLKIGRVRVRILGWHTEVKTTAGIPTQQLPWAMVMQPITSAAMSGLGRSPTGILQGSWVVGFFLDGENAQQPFVLGSYAGIQKPDKIKDQSGDTEEIPAVPYNDFRMPREPNKLMKTTIGFRDPDGIYPIEGRMNEPDTNRLVRNENVDWTVVQKKKKSVVSCDTALYGSWKEPETPYAAKYPKNHVTETESGHIVEFDDTPDSERIHVYHKSGTFTEIHPKGSEVHKVVGNSWDVTLNDKMIYVRGNASFNSDKVLKIKTGSHLEIEADGDMRILVKGNAVIETQGNSLHKVSGKVNISSEGDLSIVSQGALSMEGKTITLKSPRIDLNPNGGENPSPPPPPVLSTLRPAVLKVFDQQQAIKSTPSTPTKSPLPSASLDAPSPNPPRNTIIG